jgi:hypothetical protein
MSGSNAVSSTSAPKSSLVGSLARRAAVAVGVLGILAGTASAVQAQDAPTKRWDLSIPGGMVFPTGAQRDAIKRAQLTALQISYSAGAAVSVVGTFGWARSRDVASVDEPKLDVFTYDLGVELAPPRLGESVTFRPFVGLGAGGRSYNYRSLPVDATHNPAAYGGLGSEVGKGRLTLRVEARDYLTGFTPLDGRGGSSARNDVVMMAGVRFAWR